jgi:hypothetical protein
MTQTTRRAITLTVLAASLGIIIAVAEPHRHIASVAWSLFTAFTEAYIVF